MPVNKKALTRYLAYDKLLRSKVRRYTWKELVSAASDALREEGLNGIGKTQFYADMQYMQCCEWKAPVEAEADPDDKRIKYFFYSDPDYSISNQPLSDAEMSHLRSAVKVLQRFRGIPQFEWVNEIIPAIESRLGLVRTEKEIMSFENNADYEGLVNITSLYNAIVGKRVVQVQYQDFRTQKPYQITFHPWYLKQYNNRWFAFGLNPQRTGTIQNLALDRIKDIREIHDSYIPSDIDWEDYFSDFIGVTKNYREPVEVKLLISDEEQAAYIRTKPLHQSQKPLRKVEGGYETSIRVIPNYELEKLIMSFGERMMVISPVELRQKIGERLKTGWVKYGV